MQLEEIYTLEEVAKHLRLPLETVMNQISSGNLDAIKIGSEIRVSESDLTAFKRKMRVTAITNGAPGNGNAPDLAAQLKTIPDFDHKWPHMKGEPPFVEHFTHAHEGRVPFGGKSYLVRLGFTNRESAGCFRRRCVVFVDGYPTVEFVGADAQGNGQLASVVKDRARKHIPAGASLPPEYQGMPIGSYRDVVDGPNASNGAAVICDASDFATMVKHALIRYHYWEERK